LAKEYVGGSPIRQDLLETALRWISKGHIEEYMSRFQHELNANDLWLYFQNVIAWVKVLFPAYRKEMKGVDWGGLYNSFQQEKFDASELEKQVRSLMMDDEVTKRSGIYPYLITNDTKYLSLRAFTDNQKRLAYEKQAGKCSLCGQIFDIDDMEGDHITPWVEGGKTTPDNLQMLCKNCNRRKGKN
jgi:hypothetical protein